MITALNTSLIGVGRVPTCRVCDMAVPLTACEQEKQKRLRRAEHTVLRSSGEAVTLYSGGNAIDAECVACKPTQYCGKQMTPADGKFALTVDNGNIYATIIDGRHNQVLDIMCDVIFADGTRTKAHRVVHIYRRPVVSTCLQDLRTTRTPNRA